MQHAWRDFTAADARPIPYHEALRFGPAFPSTCPSTFPPTFPEDAHARIHRPARSATTSGKARTKDWVLRFERRTPPIIEPLMGWTGGDDTLTQVELRFPTLEAAIAYAERQGLAYRVEGAGRTDRRAMEREEAQRRALEEVFASLVLRSILFIKPHYLTSAYPKDYVSLARPWPFRFHSGSNILRLAPCIATPCLR